jgi:RNA polymerase sigma-70 factor (ECF subfamily)
MGTWEESALDDLVIRARQGNATAFDELAMRHVRDLYRMATAMVGTADAGDVTQDALLAAWRDLPRLRDPARFGAWVRRILMNRCRDVLRHRARHASAELPPEVMGSTSDVAGVDRRMTVEAGLAELTDLQRGVIVLHYLAGLTLPEVADTLRIPEGTVKSRLHQALAALRAYFGENAP